MVAHRADDERRVKVSLSFEPAIVDYLDAYTAAHPTMNRSRVVEMAVRAFRQREIEESLERQYEESEAAETQRERADWQRIRRAAAQRLFTDE